MTSATGPATGVTRTDNLALIFQEVLTAVVRLRSNRQELSDANRFVFTSARQFGQQSRKRAINRATMPTISRWPRSHSSGFWMNRF